MWNHSEVCILQLLTVATPISIGISILIVLKSTRNSTFPLKNRELLDQSREIYELLHIHHQNNVEETSIIELLRIRTNLIQKSSPVLRQDSSSHESHVEWPFQGECHYWLFTCFRSDPGSNVDDFLRVTGWIDVFFVVEWWWRVWVMIIFMIYISIGEWFNPQKIIDFWSHSHRKKISNISLSLLQASEYICRWFLYIYMAKDGKRWGKKMGNIIYIYLWYTAL